MIKERITKIMGLAASQARFLCITARKADCEYKSTDLAQQKLEITNQLSDLSMQYANSLNATKLIWSNDAVDGDCGLTYSLLMTPSALNDFNPYMLTTPSGAVVLNNEYAAAAKAAGISKTGGVGSQESRDKFISALVAGGIVTEETAKAITKYDYKPVGSGSNISFESDSVAESDGVAWNELAGRGGVPKNKSSVEAMQLSDLILTETIGQQVIDWGLLTVGNNQITDLQYERDIKNFDDLISQCSTGIITQDIVNQLKKDRTDYEVAFLVANPGKSIDDLAGDTTYLEICRLIADAEELRDNPSSTDMTKRNNILNHLQCDKTTYMTKYSPTSTPPTVVGVDKDKFNLGSTDGLDSVATGNTGKYSIVINDLISHEESNVKNLTIGDILANDVVIVTNLKGKGQKEDVNDFKSRFINIFTTMVASFGYSPDKSSTGVGLNIDDKSAEALKFAYNMTVSAFSRSVTGGDKDKSTPMDNSAYNAAMDYNRIGLSKSGDYAAISLSNMLSAFLTYYDNSLNGLDSEYIVGKSLEQSSYVTDDLNYYYMMQDSTDALTKVKDKSADFFDELYNNIIEHGWREDASIDDSEYMETMIKNGRYAISSLNWNDGYYYQTRYNDAGYIVEVSDTDAIARAEAEFNAKKYELTYKEDSIDLKTKKLDAEISSLSTEYESVKSLISKSIEKTFQMFSQ